MGSFQTGHVHSPVVGLQGQDVTHEIHEELIIEEADFTNTFVFSLREQRFVLSGGEQLKVYVAERFHVP